MQNNPFRIIKNVLRTEKGTAQEGQNKYIFCVDKAANKIDIKNAVEFIYRVKVKAVHTTVMPGKIRRIRYKSGHTNEWKKAIITLPAGEKIKLG